MVVSVVAVVVATVRVGRERRQARLVEIAEAAQRAVLPILPAQAGPLRAAARYVSAAEDALVGGDFYDLYHSDRCVRLLVGDVRGKGLEAIEHAARVIRAFRQSAASSEELSAVAKQMNDYLVPFFSDEEFATALLIHVDGDRNLTLVNCGHPPPLLSGPRGTRFLESPPNLPLGLATSFEARDVTWEPGDRLLLYTDGLVEARDRRGRYLSLDAIAGCLGEPTPDAVLESLLASVKGHVAGGNFGDDLAAGPARERLRRPRIDGPLPGGVGWHSSAQSASRFGAGPEGDRRGPP